MSRKDGDGGKLHGDHFNGLGMLDFVREKGEESLYFGFVTDLRPSYTPIFFPTSRGFLRGMANSLLHYYCGNTPILNPGWLHIGALVMSRAVELLLQGLFLFSATFPGTQPMPYGWRYISSAAVPSLIQRQLPPMFTAFLSWYHLLSPGMNVPVSLQACSGLTSGQVLI